MVGALTTLVVAEDVGTWSLLRGRNQVWYPVTSDDPLASAKSVSLFTTLKCQRDEDCGLLVDAAMHQLFINITGPNDSILTVRLR